MRVECQPPRLSEAKLKVSKLENLIIEPRFFEKQGLAPIMFFSVFDSKGKPLGRFLVKANSTTGMLKMFRLKELKPEIDQNDGKEKEES